jgi:hypothetical protein
MPESVSKTSKVQVVWANLEFFRRDPIDFLSRLVTMDETWLYHYEPETKQKSLEWRHRDHPTPKIPSAKIRWKSSRLPGFVGIKTASSSLTNVQGAKLSTRSISHHCWYNWRTFWRRNAAGSSPRKSCPCTKIPRLTRHSQPKRNWPTCVSIVLITHPILRIWSCRNTTCSLVWKTIETSPFFVRRGGHCCRGDLVGRTKFWIFLSGLKTLEQLARKCIELRGEYVE